MKKTINWRFTKKFIYPFFFVHMWCFWFVWFSISYFQEWIEYLSVFWWGLFSITLYLVFYLIIFWIWKIKDMFINAIIWCISIYAWMWNIMLLFGKDISSSDRYWHIIPWLYFVLYTFLLRNLLRDVSLIFNKKHWEKIWDYIFYWFGWISLISSFFI
jgi:hypothetical protein